MRKIIIFLLLLLIPITGCVDKKSVDNLYIRVSNIDYSIYEQYQNNTLTIKQNKLYVLSIDGWNKKEGIVEIDRNKLVLTKDDKYLRLEDSDFNFVLIGISTGNTVLNVKYEDIMIDINIVIEENKKYKTSVDIKIIESFEIFDSFDIKNYDFINHMGDKKISPFNIELLNADYGYYSFNESKNNLTRSDEKYNYLFEYNYRSSNINYESDFIDNKYYTDEFIGDLKKLENDEISAIDIYSKYGTNIVTNTADFIYLNIQYDIISTDTSKDITIIKNAIGYYFRNAITENDLNIILSQGDIDFHIITTLEIDENNWKDSIKILENMIDSKNYEHGRMITYYKPLYFYIPFDHPCYFKLRDCYVNNYRKYEV